MYTFSLVVMFFLSGNFIAEVDSSWWYFSQFDQVSAGQHRILCEVIPNLNKKQRQICKRNPELIKVVGDGIKKGILECQFQFRHQRWNCSTFPNDSSLFGKTLVRGGTRELAFVMAMNSASAIYKLASSCSRGHPKCGCSTEIPNGKRTNQTIRDGVFKWEGCEHVVKFSTGFIRRFVDAAEHRLSDGKAKFTMHNNRVGRIIVRRSMEKICRCHGISGSCSMRTCWDTLPTFRVIGTALRNKYDSAVGITFKPSGHIIPTDRRHRKPNKFNLIYYENSPDYCQINLAKGSVGTQSRVCQNSMEGEESCDILCCQKYDFAKVRYSYYCNCTFSWCCQVNCGVCNGTRIEYRCK